MEEVPIRWLRRERAPLQVPMTLRNMEKPWQKTLEVSLPSRRGIKVGGQSCSQLCHWLVWLFPNPCFVGLKGNYQCANSLTFYFNFRRRQQQANYLVLEMPGMRPGSGVKNWMLSWEREQIHDGVLANLVFYYGDQGRMGLRVITLWLAYSHITCVFWFIFQKCLNRKLSEFCRQTLANMPSTVLGLTLYTWRVTRSPSGSLN